MILLLPLQSYIRSFHYSTKVGEPQLTDSAYRQKMLKNVTDETVVSFWRVQYDELSKGDRDKRVASLVGRLESIRMGRPIIRGILGQKETTLDLRHLTEQRRILLVKLPVKTLAQDARLIGTILVSEIYAAIFSFADTLPDKRPGVCLYVDEFANFATPDFSSFFTEARKYGAMVTIAHQHRSQLPAYLQDSTETARNKVVFQVTPSDGQELARTFADTQGKVQPEQNPVEYLLREGSSHLSVRVFIETYLRPFHLRHRKDRRVTIKRYNGYVEVDNPLVPLNHLLYSVMKHRNAMLPIPVEVLEGFSGIGQYYEAFHHSWRPSAWLSADLRFPAHLVIEKADGTRYWTRKPEGDRERMYHFLFFLRETMRCLAQEPIGKKETLALTDVAHTLSSLPKRIAYVRSGERSGLIRTDDLPQPLDADEFEERLERITAQSRATYCQPKVVDSPPLEEKPDEVDEPASPWEEVD